MVENYQDLEKCHGKKKLIAKHLQNFKIILNYITSLFIINLWWP